MSRTPIADHALLSNCRSAALVDRRGSVEWWCVPRFDSASVFGRLLGDAAGHFSLTPADITGVDRHYADESLVLVTRLTTATGVVELTETLAMADGVRGHDLGHRSPDVLLRRLACTDGHVDVDVEMVPRFEYGLTTPVVDRVGDRVVARGGPTALVLSSDSDVEAEGSKAVGRLRLEAGQRAAFAVEYASSWDDLPEAWKAADIEARIADTLEGWRSWAAEHQRYDGPYADLVHHSGRVLYGLTYCPTGAIVAAPTTSLPESVGGERNWDYRYTWIRDASFTLDALWVAACPDEAGGFLDYLTTVASTFHESQQLQIMFGIHGERDLTERQLPWLEGWGDSRPVRVGNGAWTQPQLDVYGELISAVHLLREQHGELDPLARRFLVGIADAAAASWERPDHGIWEIRGEPDHYLYSKLMCWVALDRAVDLAGDIGGEERVDDWAAERDRIRDTILERGYDERLGAFTQTFGGDTLDASNLLIARVGFLPPDDPRVVGTIEATEHHLTDDRGLVYRYRGDDGLEGEEGTFLLCTFWLAEALALAGRPERAREVLARACGCANDVGLFSEEVDPGTGQLLGNFPQAFSHIGLVNASWALQVAEQGAAFRQPPDRSGGTA